MYIIFITLRGLFEKVDILMPLCVCRRGNLPWLYYGDEPGLANRVLQTEPIPIRFSFRGKSKVSHEASSSLIVCKLLFQLNC